MPVVVYRDPSGAPTCGANFQSGEVCIFCRTKSFGTIHVCALSDAGRLRSSDAAYLVPLKGCPLWKP